MLLSIITLAAVLLAAGELDSLRDFLAHSLAGAALTDSTLRTGMEIFHRNLYGWKTDDGHCHSTIATTMIIVRGLAALVEEDTDCLLYTSPSPRDGLLSRMPSSA